MIIDQKCWYIFTVDISLLFSVLQPTIILLWVDWLLADVADEFLVAASTVTVMSKVNFLPFNKALGVTHNCSKSIYKSFEV